MPIYSRMRISPWYTPEDNIYGDETVPFVATGNATGEFIALVLIPLLDWLGIEWMIENPVPLLQFAGCESIC